MSILKTDHHPNVYNLLRATIEEAVRGNIKHDIKERLIKEFSEKIDDELEPLVRQITIESLERILDIDSIGEKFNLHVKVSK